MTSRSLEEKATSTEVNDDTLPTPATCGLIGLVGGIVGGFLGGGGGIVTVPAMDHFTTLPRAKIHGTANLANVSIAIAGTIVYALHGGAIDSRVGIGLMCGGLIGAPLGARLAAYLSERMLRLIFVLVLLISGIKIVLDSIQPASQATSGLLPAQQIPLALLIALAFFFGLFIGAWSSSIGLGGGLLAIPTRVLIFGINQHTAAGTSLLVMIPNTISGSITHLRQGTASLRLGRMLSIGSLVGAVIGSWIAFLLSNQRLELIFGCFVLIMAFREGYSFIHRLRLSYNRK